MPDAPGPCTRGGRERLQPLTRQEGREPFSVLGRALARPGAGLKATKPTVGYPWPGWTRRAALPAALLSQANRIERVWLDLHANVSRNHRLPNKVAIFSNLQPPTTTVAAWLPLGESLHWEIAVGGVLVLAGVRLTQTAHVRPPPSAPVPLEAERQAA